MNSTNTFDITLGRKRLSFTASYSVGRPEPDVGFFNPIVEIDWITAENGKFVTDEVVHDLISDEIAKRNG
tara:strand:+ start:557 stop:766 length:210 start_codon:yes stop_codon:yes gene_type:complete